MLLSNIQIHVEFLKISSISFFSKCLRFRSYSAFGGVIACNYKINEKIAKEISKNFLEVLLATGFNKSALTILKKKKICI